MPALRDFVRFESADPVLLATKDTHYPALLERLYKSYDAGLNQTERKALELLSHEVLTARGSTSRHSSGSSCSGSR